MSVQEEPEVERKYDVDEAAVVPDLTGLPGVAATAEAFSLDQVATYYDTVDFRLLHARVTLRRRVGGVDDGWHLKLPAAGDARHEVRLPGGADGGPVPDELLRRVRVHLRGRPVAPTATVRTVRTVHRLLGEDGHEVAEVCDDHVEATAVGGKEQRWREWELEVKGEGSESLLDAAGPALLAAGARPAAVGSKVARVVAGSAPARPAWRDAPAVGPASTVGDVFTAYAAGQLLRLEEQDRLFRVGDDTTIHQLRVAARRLRSALATYDTALGGTADLRQELRRLGLAVGAARDAQVLRDRLLELARLRPGYVDDQAVHRLEEELTAAFDAGRAEAAAALDAPRYLHLLDRLEALVAAPPTTEAGTRRAAEALPGLLAREHARLQRRHRAWQRAEDSETRTRALHEVRKAAKRLRYAAESAVPVLGDPARSLTAGAEALQELLGEHQDTVMARRRLREVAVRVGESGAYDQLREAEEQRAAELVGRYPTVLEQLPAP